MHIDPNANTNEKKNVDDINKLLSGMMLQTRILNNREELPELTNGSVKTKGLVVMVFAFKVFEYG